MGADTTPRHPAKYTDSFIPIFANRLIEHGCKKIIDPFAGTGKIGEIKSFGWDGIIFANEIEQEWLQGNEYGCDVLSFMDAEELTKAYELRTFDGIVTSPTYGNRMADHHNAKDGSYRITYTHCIGRQLTDGNTGAMQWGERYREKHKKIYTNICGLVKRGGLFILNISNHIRKGEEVDVSSFHKDQIMNNGFTLVEDCQVETPRNKFGKNAEKRCKTEHIYVFEKVS